MSSASPFSDAPHVAPSVESSPPAGLPLPVALHWSPRSPFVRKVMIVLIECGLADGVERIRTPVDRRQPNLAYMAENPLGTIPALRLADGTLLTDSPLICDYLLTLRPRPDLLPPDGTPRRFDVLRRQAFADAMLDAILVWRQERIRPAAERSDAMLSAYAVKARTALDRLDRDAAGQAGFDLGHVATGCALAYLDLRFPDLDWRRGRADLAAWHRDFETHPSARATALAHG